MALDAFMLIRATARYLGIILSADKDRPPSQFQEVLGMFINTFSKVIQLKNCKSIEYSQAISSFLSTSLPINWKLFMVN